MCTVVLNNYNKFNKGDYSIQTTSQKDFFFTELSPLFRQIFNSETSL